MDFVKKYGLKGLVSLLFVAIGGMKVTQNPQMIESLVGLGYPAYLGYILGGAYLLGVAGIWQTVFGFVRNWAYGGMCIATLGAIASHILAGDPITAAVPALVIGALAAGAWYLDNRA